MKSKLFCSLVRQAQAINWVYAVWFAVTACVIAAAVPAKADAPQWMHALVNVPVPAHDEKTNAVLLYEVESKEGAEISLPKIEGSELITDVKAKLIDIPAPDPGNIIGYEYELEEQPLVLQEGWSFQRHVPVRESHYQLQLPSGWEYKAN